MNNSGRVSPSCHTFSQPEATPFFPEARISYCHSPAVRAGIEYQARDALLAPGPTHSRLL